MELILAPKPKRSFIFNRKQREFIKPVIHITDQNPFEIDISPIASFIGYQDKNSKRKDIMNHSHSHCLNNSGSLFCSTLYNFEKIIKEIDVEELKQRCEYEASSEIINILSATKEKVKLITSNNSNAITNFMGIGKTNIKTEQSCCINDNTYNKMKRPYFNKNILKYGNSKRPLIDKLIKIHTLENNNDY